MKRWLTPGYERPLGWQVNRRRPGFWCWLLHRAAWFSNDFGTWYTSGRTSFEVECQQCGACWTERV